LVFVETARDERFERRGPHLWRVEEIEVADAVLGTKCDVPTLEGNASATIPPGTQPDTTLRLRGASHPRPGNDELGDLYVTIRVIIPTSITAKARKLFEQLRSQTMPVPATQDGAPARQLLSGEVLFARACRCQTRSELAQTLLGLSIPTGWNARHYGKGRPVRCAARDLLSPEAVLSSSERESDSCTLLNL
jgi:hypothetical protein